jgi:hypothetical protein
MTKCSPRELHLVKTEEALFKAQLQAPLYEALENKTQVLHVFL